MKLLIIGGQKTNEHMANNIERDGIKFLSPKELNEKTFAGIIKAVDTFDHIIFHFEETKAIYNNAQKVLVEIIKSVKNPNSIVVIVEGEKLRLALADKLKNRATVIDNLNNISFLTLKPKYEDETATLDYLEELIGSDPTDEPVNNFNPNNDSQSLDDLFGAPPTDNPMNSIDAILGEGNSLSQEDSFGMLNNNQNPVPSNDPFDSIFGGQNNIPMSPPAATPQPQNSPLDELFGGMNQSNPNQVPQGNPGGLFPPMPQAAPQQPSMPPMAPVQPAPGYDPIADILGGSPTTLPQSNLPGMFGQEGSPFNDSGLDSILNQPPQSPVPGIQIEQPRGAGMAPNTGMVPNIIPNPGQNNPYMIDESKIPETKENSGKLSGFLDKIIGEGKMSPTKLPGIPENAIPTNLRRPYVITFWASKGGTGKTTVALNTCAYISILTNLNVILVDVDEFGDTGLSVGMIRSSGEDLPTVDDFLSHISTLNTYEDVSHFILTETTTRLNILLSSPNSSTPNRPTKDDYQNVLRVLQNHFDIIAFDCGDKLWDDITRFAIVRADFLVLVVDQGFPTLSHISNIIEDFAGSSTGVGKEKMIMVVNKFQKDVGMSINDIGQWFGNATSSIHVIPAIFYEAMKNLNESKLLILTSNAEIKKAYNRIVIDLLNKIKENQEQASQYQSYDQSRQGQGGYGQGNF